MSEDYCVNLPTFLVNFNSHCLPFGRPPIPPPPVRAPAPPCPEDPISVMTDETVNVASAVPSAQTECSAYAPCLFIFFNKSNLYRVYTKNLTLM